MKRLATLIVLTWGTTAIAAAVPVGTTFSYQGRLDDGGVPADGEYDMRFSLYDAPTGGNRVGPILIFDGLRGNPEPIDVDTGLFSTGLNFGDDVFVGDALWLEIQVRPHAIGSYVTLAPRQPLTAVPYALHALSAPGGVGGFWSDNGNHIYSTNSGSVGIGTTDPIAHLEVVGGILSSGPDGGIVSAHNPNNPTAGVGLGWHNDVARLRIGGEGPGSGGGFDIQKTGDRSLLRILHNGNVGIGTTEPAEKLHVAGEPGVDGIMFPDGTLQTSAAGPSGGVWSPNGADIYNNNSGNVGIGTTTPRTKLDVFGEDAVVRVESIRNDFGPKLVFRNRTAGTGVTRGTIQFQDADNTLGQIHYSAPRFGPAALSMFTAGGGLSILDNGNVGVGVGAPEYKLEVEGRARIRQAGSSSAGIWFYQDEPAEDRGFVGMRTDTQIGMYSRAGASWGLVMDAVTGDVGIGDVTPAARLGVYKNESDNRAAINATNTGTGVAGYFATTNNANASPALFAATSTSAPAFATLGDAVINGEMTVNGTAQVEILEIVGADLAEKFPVSDRPEPGMVVEIDPARTGTLRIAQGGAYNPRVAGVVSGANDLSVGAVLGNLPGHDDAPPIALSGRVWVHCDASTGAIQPGDLLTTSDTPGHAMKAGDRSRAYGATIGKAMSSLESGTGMVLVLVSLQ